MASQFWNVLAQFLTHYQHFCGKKKSDAAPKSEEGGDDHISKGRPMKLLDLFLKKLCQNFQEIISCNTLTRTNILVLSVISILLLHNTVTKCWSNLLLKCHIFLICNKHRSYCITRVIIRFMLLLVCLEPVTTWCWSIRKWCNHCTSVFNARMFRQQLHPCKFSTAPWITNLAPILKYHVKFHEKEVVFFVW